MPWRVVSGIIVLSLLMVLALFTSSDAFYVNSIAVGGLRYMTSNEIFSLTNVTGLHIGNSLHVRDLDLPASVKAVTSADAIVCAVRAKAAEVEEAPAAEGEAAEPEILTRRKEEEPGEGGEKK